MLKTKEYLKLIRVKHYLKNLLIFLPLLFSSNLFDFKKFITILFGFFAFSFTCSIVYVLNDLMDLEKDKIHSKKKNRPLASGKITKFEAIITIFILVFLIMLISFFNEFNLISISILLLYLFMNILYSIKLKDIPIIDVFILTIGFILRVIFGGKLIDVQISNWLYLTIMYISFYLALGKRRNEIEKYSKTRKVLKYYNKSFLDKNMYMFLSIGIVFYSLWTIDVNTAIDSNYLIYTVPLVMLILMRYSMIIESDSDGDPIEVVFSDKMLLLGILFYGVSMLFIMYLI